MRAGPGAVGSANWLTSINGVLYFSGFDDESHRQLYRAKSSFGSEVLVEKLEAATEIVTPALFTQVGERVVFNSLGPNGRELHVIEGLTARELADIAPGAPSSNPFELTSFEDSIFFSAHGPQGREPYKTDGESVRLLSDILPDGGSSDPRDFKVIGDKLFFVATGSHGRELYVSDGNSVSRVTDLNPGPLPSFDPGLNFFSEVEDRLLFQFSDEGGLRWYTTDGELVAPLIGQDSGATWSSRSFVAFGDWNYFVADYGSGNLLYRTDGILMEQVANLPPSLQALGAPLLVLNGALVFPGGNDQDWALYRAKVIPEPSVAECVLSVAIVFLMFARRRTVNVNSLQRSMHRPTLCIF